MANTHSLTLVRASQQFVDSDNNNSNGDITDDLTVEAWVKQSSNGNIMVVVSKDNNGDGGAANKSWNMYIDNSNFFQFYLSNDGSSIVNQGTNNAISVNTWTHIAITRKRSTGDIHMYKNGVVDGVTLGFNTGAIKVTNASIRAGIKGATSRVDAFDGNIDEVRIWNVVRTAGEILANYQRELAGNEPGLKVYWKFNNSYNDTSPSVLTGSPSGTPSFTTDVPFADNTTTSTSTTSSSTSSSTTTTSTSTTSTSSSTSSSTSTSRTTSTSTTSTSTTSTITTTSTTTTSTSTTSTSSSTTTTSTSTSTTTSTSTSTTITMDLKLIVEKAK